MALSSWRSETFQQGTATAAAPRFEFPFKLHAILSDAPLNNQEHIVSWLPPGRDNNNRDYDAFKIHDREAFESIILPRYFLTTPKYRSFTRQLGIYDFEMLKGDPTTMEFGAYSHPLFRRGQPDLCNGMTRTRVKNKWTRTVKNKQPQQDLWLHLQNNTTKNTNKSSRFDDPIELDDPHWAFTLPKEAAAAAAATSIVPNHYPSRDTHEEAHSYDNESTTTLPLLNFARMANTYLSGMEHDPSDLSDRQVQRLDTLGANIAHAMRMDDEYPSYSSSCSVACGAAGGGCGSSPSNSHSPFQNTAAAGVATGAAAADYETTRLASQPQAFSRSDIFATTTSSRVVLAAGMMHGMDSSSSWW